MKRREFIAAAGVVAGLLFAASASAQVPGRVYRVATLSPIPKGRSSPDATVRDELARHGFIEKQNLILDLRGEGVSEAQMAVIARDLVESGTDAIYSVGDAATRVAAGATTTIPIVAMSDDLVASKLVASFAKPGGNVTGVSILAHELDGKRQDLLIELVPNMHRLALLSDPATTVPGHIEALIEAGRNRGVSVALYQAATAEEVPMALTSAKIDGADAINVLAAALFAGVHAVIIERTATLRLPAIYQWPHYTAEGALIGYGPSGHSTVLLVAQQLVKVLHGVKVGDIPVEQPTTFTLSISLIAAKSLGLSVPLALLAQADEVIE